MTACHCAPRVLCESCWQERRRIVNERLALLGQRVTLREAK
jgi:hypothetical protein